MLEYIQEYLSPDNSVHTVSAPLLLFIKVTLNCSHTISRFIELGMLPYIYPYSEFYLLSQYCLPVRGST